MWWEPEDAASRETRSIVIQLHRDYLGYLEDADRWGDEPLLCGVGAAVTPVGWAPLLLVSHEQLERADLAAPTGRFALGLAEVLPELGERVYRALGNRPPPDTLIEVVHAPTPAWSVAPGSLVREATTPAIAAAVGLPCTTVAGDPALLTAGHLVTTSPPGAVELLATDAAGRTAWRPGVVVQHSDPITSGVTGGYDWAVIVPDIDDQGRPTFAVPALAHRGPLPPPTAPYLPMNVRTPGRTYGTVTGALVQWGDATRQWLSCWMLGPSHLLQRGDSGTALLGQAPGRHQNAAFGLFVGGSGWPGQPFNQLFVQDLGQAMTAGLDQLINL